MNFSIKLKRILVLGIAVIGLVFLNKALIINQPKSKSGFTIQPLSQGFSLIDSWIERPSMVNKLKSFPAPEEFKSFSHNQELIKTEETCSDVYYVILIYKTGIDYRENPEAAKLNKASSCPASKVFKIELKPPELNLEPGGYYLIIADQGKEGSWYNPR